MGECFIARRGGGGSSGARAVPRDDAGIWQSCAGIKEKAGDTAALLSDPEKLNTLFSSGNAMDYLRRSPVLLAAVVRDREAVKILDGYAFRTPGSYLGGAAGDNIELGKIETSGDTVYNYNPGRAFNYKFLGEGQSCYNNKRGEESWIQINFRGVRQPFVIYRRVFQPTYISSGTKPVVTLRGVGRDGRPFDISDPLTISGRDVSTKDFVGLAAKNFKPTTAFRLNVMSTGSVYFRGGAAWRI